MEFGRESLEATDSPAQPPVIALQAQSVAALVVAVRVVIEREPQSP
jgi:hypothetical protein